MIKRPLTCILIALLLVGAGGCRTTPAPVRSGGGDIQALAWLAGSWVDLERGAVEDWTKPVDGMMLGANRTIVDGQTVFFEVLAIDSTPQGLVYLASPKGRFPPTRFPLVESTEKRAVFENPDHDFPQRIIYWMEEDGRLRAKIEGTEAGQYRTATWTFQTAG